MGEDVKHAPAARRENVLAIAVARVLRGFAFEHGARDRQAGGGFVLYPGGELALQVGARVVGEGGLRLGAGATQRFGNEQLLGWPASVHGLAGRARFVGNSRE